MLKFRVVIRAAMILRGNGQMEMMPNDVGVLVYACARVYIVSYESIPSSPDVYVKRFTYTFIMYMYRMCDTLTPVTTLSPFLC